MLLNIADDAHAALRAAAAVLAGRQRDQDAERRCSPPSGSGSAGSSRSVENIHQTLTYDNGIFLRWLGNTLLYVVAGAGGATLLATLAGYGLAKYEFPGKRAVFAVVLGAVAVPGTALAVPTFLMFSKLGLTNTPWAVIIPSLVSPFGLYLMWVYAPRRDPDRAAGGGPDRRGRRVPHLLHHLAAAAGARASSRCCCSRWSRPGTTTSCR